MWWLVGLALLAVLVLVGTSLSSRPAPELGAVDGRLRPCPSSPNCVCSTDPDADHHVRPLEFDGDPAAAFARLREVVGRMSSARERSHDDGYAWFVFTTPVLRFRDDVEFLLDAEDRVIHVRSASRVGHSDFGVNRRRVERIREAFPAGED